MPKSQKKKQSKMTLDKLALMMSRGFNDVHEKFDEVDNKFKEVDKRFDEVDKKFDEVDNKFKEVDKRFDDVGKKLNDIIDTQDKILKDVEDLKDENVMDMAFRDRFDALERRLERVETKVKS